jgi:hypothetical protein
LGLAAFGLLAGLAHAQTDLGVLASAPYKVLDTAQLMGNGGIDYVSVDNDGRRIYVPRGTNTYVFDLDQHKYIGAIAGVGGHGVAIDTASHHGFSSARQIAMFDTQTMQKIKDIEVQGNPDGILFEPFTGRVLVFSHRSPNVTLIDPKDGSITGTLELGGSPEQAQSDGQGKLYVDLEDKDKVAVVDLKAMNVVTNFDLQGKGGGPGGLGLDAKNHVLFAMCHEPATCVILNADNGGILATVPIGNGTDGGGFNPNTMEAWSSQRDGTLTVIKESSSTSFAVEQTVTTKTGCKTSSLDSKNNVIVTVCTERMPGLPTPPPSTNAPAGERPRFQRGGPGNLDVLWVGR